jgi:4-azaleucine resistance transporter AzlC
MPPTSTTPGREFFAGIKAVFPILIGAALFGMIYGVLAAGAGLPPTVAQGMSLWVFAGAAQFAAVSLIVNGAPAAIVLLTTAVINLRHALYGASLAPYLRHLRPGGKWLLAFLTTDEAYALSIMRYRRTETRGAPGDRTHWFFLGVGVMVYFTWQAGTAVGIHLGARVPTAWELDFTLPLTFIGLLIPALTDRPSLAAAVAAGAVATLAWGLPLRLGLILGVLCGVIAGLYVGYRSSIPRHRSLPSEASR